MNRRELVAVLAERTETDKRAADAALQAFIDTVTETVASGEPVAISGFAKFARVDRAARMGRNPQTGEAIRIKASRRVARHPAEGVQGRGAHRQAPAKKAAKKTAPAKKAAAKRGRRRRPRPRRPPPRRPRRRPRGASRRAGAPRSPRCGTTRRKPGATTSTCSTRTSG